VRNVAANIDFANSASCAAPGIVPGAARVSGIHVGIAADASTDHVFAPLVSIPRPSAQCGCDHEDIEAVGRGITSAC